jgi:hypothetical protein
MLGALLQPHYRRPMNSVSRDGYFWSGRRYTNYLVRLIVGKTTAL